MAEKALALSKSTSEQQAAEADQARAEAALKKAHEEKEKLIADQKQKE